MKVGNKIISIKDVYDPNGNILLIDEYEICTIYSIKPTIDLPLYISIYDKHNYTLTFSAIKGNKYYIWDYFITYVEYRKLKLNKINNKIK